MIRTRCPPINPVVFGRARTIPDRVRPERRGSGPRYGTGSRVCRFLAGCAGSRLPGGQARRPRSLADQSLTQSAQMRFAAVPLAVAAPRLPRRLPALPPVGLPRCTAPAFAGTAPALGCRTPRTSRVIQRPNVISQSYRQTHHATTQYAHRQNRTPPPAPRDPDGPAGAGGNLRPRHCGCACNASRSPGTDPSNPFSFTCVRWLTFGI